MSKHANPTLVGAFIVGALALAVVTVLQFSGGQWFGKQQQQILYFESAGQGLQVGSPVVFLGVRVGSVKQIQLSLEEDSCQFLVAVSIVIEPSLVSTRTGEMLDLRDAETLQGLVERGLRGRLQMQSLLTGQLYIDLDFHPDKPAQFFALDSEPNEIPTIPTTVETLSRTLEDFPMEQFLGDLAAVSGSMRALLGAEETAALPQQLNRTLRHYESLGAKLDAESAPILRALRADLAALDQTLVAVARAADQIAALADSESALAGNLSRAGEELAGAARAVRDFSRESSPAVEHFNATLMEISRAARALRLLADTLEQQPEALLRGKRGLEENHAQ